MSLSDFQKILVDEGLRPSCPVDHETTIAQMKLTDLDVVQLIFATREFSPDFDVEFGSAGNMSVGQWLKLAESQETNKQN
jgi:hypothetical protein